MPTQMVANRIYQRQTVAGTDGVFAGIYLPQGTRVSGVRGYANLEASTIQTTGKVGMFSIEGWVMHVQNVDDAIDMDSEWDTHVPKDTPLDLIDLAHGGPDPANFWEPGEIDWTTVFGIGNIPERLFQARRLCSFGINSLSTNRDPESPFGYEFLAGTRVPLSINRPFMVDEPSLMAFALSSPNTTSTSSLAPLSSLVEAEWGQLQYIDHVLERAMLAALGVVEVGAETPWNEAADLLRKHLDPEMLETQSGYFEPLTWRVTGEMQINHSVMGQMPRRNITGGR